MIKDEKSETIRGYTYRYSAEWTEKLETERHWRLYWFQQKIMQGFVKSGDHVLEIGIGAGFTTNYLKSKGVRVTTLDIDERKKPNIVANVVEYDFPDVYDHILAFEVFEHIPFYEVEKLFAKLPRICRKNMFISVPRNELVWLRLDIWLPKLGNKLIEITTRKHKITVPYHYWEIDYKSMTCRNFKRFLKKAGFKIVSQEKKWSLVYFVLES